MIPIALTIIAAVWAGVAAEGRYPGRAAAATRRALTVVLYTVLPVVVFFNLSRTDLDHNFALGIVFGWIAVTICALLAYLVADRLLGLSRPQTGSVICCVLVANSGALGFPLVAAVLGFDLIGEAVLFDVAVTGVALMVGAFSVGAAFGTRAGQGPRERTRAFFLRNTPLYAAALALIAPDSLAPEWAVDGSRGLIVLLLPLGFLAVGASLAEGGDGRLLNLPRSLRAAVATVAALKLVLLPALLLLLAAPLIDLPTSFLLLAAMPSGINAMVVSQAYGLDMKITAGAVAWTTAIAVPLVLVASLV